MTGDPIPDSDHVAHYCSLSKIEDGLPASDAFLPRRSEEYLSVNWLEHFADAPDTTSAIQCIRDVLREKIKVKGSGRLAVLDVGEVRRAARKVGNGALRVEQQPEDEDPSHAGIMGYEGGRTQSDLRVAAALQSLVRQCHMHRAI